MMLLTGIPACTREINGHRQHATPARYGAALLDAANAVPVLIPPVGERAVAPGVQWHPEWDYAADASSLALFGNFGNACRTYAGGIRRAA